MFKRVFVALATVLLVLFSVDAFAAFGRTAGTFEVSSFKGSAHYTIPLWTPPGVKGLQPKLSLTYDSQLGYGFMGPGWNISGLSSISRCNRTYAQDGTPAAVTLTVADAFCLDGNRLRLTNSDDLSTYGQAGTTYETEIDNFSKVIASTSTAGNGPQYFTVQGKDGLTYEYGNTTDSRILASSGAATPYIWALDKVTDRSGNQMTFTYLQTGGSYVPQIIHYAGGTIYFTYSPASDTSALYFSLAGMQIVQTNQLSDILAYTGDGTSRQYNLGYTYSNSTLRATLTSIQDCYNSYQGTTDCLAPTSIVYQNSTFGSLNNATFGISATATPTGSGLTIGPLYSVDIDGDGRKDLIFATFNAANGTYQWWVQFATATGYSAPVNTGAATTGTSQFLIDNFAANTGAGSAGQQILANTAGGWTLFTWNGSAFVGTSAAGISTDASATAYSSADVDGDGLADLIYVDQVGTAVQVYVQLNNAAVVNSGGLGFNSAVLTNTFTNGGPTVPGGPVLLLGNNQMPTSSLRHFDFDGDGRDDLILVTHPVIANTLHAQVSSLLSRGAAPFAVGTAVDAGAVSGQPTVLAANWNDDNCTDLIVTNFVTASSTVYLANCDGTSGGTVTLPDLAQLALDWDGDGRTDVLARSGSGWTLYQSPGGTTPTPKPIATGVPIVGTGTYIVIDADGDALDDLAFVNSNAENGIYYELHNGAGVHPDLATSFTDGYGVAVNVTYVSTAQGSYIPRSSDGSVPAAYPDREYNEPLYVVSQAEFSGPQQHTETYTYEAAWLDLQGRGFSGFGLKTTLDDRWGETLQEGHYRDFPFTGMPSSVDRIDSSGLVISDTQIVPDVVSLDSTTNNQRYFPFNSDIQINLSEPGTNLSGPYSYQETSFQYDNYGNATTVTTTLIDTSSISPFQSEQWTSVTSSSYAPNTSTWCLGLPTGVTVTNTNNFPGGVSSGPITRTIQYNNPDYTHCRETEKVTEPGNGLYQVTEDYTYDSFGNLQIDTVTGVGMAPRTTHLTWGGTGQFLTGVQDPALESVVLGYDSEGNLTSRSNPNSTSANPLVTSWHYDGFNRRILESRPDGTSTSWSYDDCATAGCVDTNWYAAPNGNKMTLTATVLNSNGSTQSVHKEYLDALNQPLVTSNTMLSGAFDRTERTYDSFGNVSGESPPCIFVGCTATVTDQSAWTLYLHDELNRLTNITRPVSATNSSYQQTFISYEGLRTSVTDANNHTVTRDYHVTGPLGRSTDAVAGYAQTLSYDAFGSLLSVTDNVFNTLFSATYDYGLQAYQRNATDMDLDVSTQAGQHRLYNYDALGELTSWSDAKGQSFSMTYDALSRPLVRTEPDLTTTWNWGSSAALYNIGQLASVSASNTSMGTYAESYTYDAQTRFQQAIIVIPGDTAYAYTATYDPTTGFLGTLAYPPSTSGYQLKLQYGYANGWLQTISNFNAPGTVFWTANATNPRGQITQETLGNGVVVNRSLDAITGWLGGVQAGVGGGAALQNASFLYDFVGNVTQRQDSNRGLTENFYYDADDRLDHSTLGGATNLQMSYDPLGTGNVASRSDVGGGTAWTYDPQRKHAVTQAGTGGPAYTYDNNGNATSRNGYPITWTSYNYPSSVAAAGESAQFLYGPDRQRFEMSYSGGAGAETTYYVGGLMEKVISNGTTDYRHTIYAGGEPVAIYSRTSAGVNTLRYLLTDHQGSIASIITDSTPGPVSNYVTESFTAYGNRRSGTTWSGPPTSGDESLINGVSREGYTGQTALGVSMGLNHMNGRVQDAVTGRFLSADPDVPDAGNTQSFNRYSYVNNNPLTLVDPTGFDDDGGDDGGGSEVDVFATLDLDGGADPFLFACPCGPGGYSLHVPTQGMPRAQSADVRQKPAANTADTAAAAASNVVQFTPPGVSFDGSLYVVSVCGDCPSVAESQGQGAGGNPFLQFIFGAADTLFKGAWQQPVNPTAGIDQSWEDLNGPYQSPFPAATTNKAQLARDLGPTAVVLASALTAKPLGAAGAIPGAIRVGGGARLANIAASDALRVQNAATRTGTEITVVGSRANGTAHALSDWDFAVPSSTSNRTIHSLKSSLPEGPRGLGEPRNQDFFKGPVDTSKPYITFTPQ